MGSQVTEGVSMQIKLLLLASLIYSLGDNCVRTASIGIDGKAELEDGLLNIMLDLRNVDHLNVMSKRGLDFGLGRGYSGSQAARHQLGLYQANYAGGPGRK